jgi:hypothetical protein
LERREPRNDAVFHDPGRGQLDPRTNAAIFALGGAAVLILGVIIAVFYVPLAVIMELAKQYKK